MFHFLQVHFPDVLFTHSKDSLLNSFFNRYIDRYIDIFNPQYMMVNMVERGQCAAHHKVSFASLPLADYRHICRASHVPGFCLLVQHATWWTIDGIKHLRCELAASKGKHLQDAKMQLASSRFWNWLSRYQKVKQRQRREMWNMTIHRWVMIDLFLWQWNWGSTTRGISTKRWLCQPSASMKHVPCSWSKLH